MMSFDRRFFRTSLFTILKHTNASSMKHLWEYIMNTNHLAKLPCCAAVAVDASAPMISRKQVKSVGLHEHSDLPTCESAASL